MPNTNEDSSDSSMHSLPAHLDGNSKIIDIPCNSRVSLYRILRYLDALLLGRSLRNEDLTPISLASLLVLGVARRRHWLLLGDFLGELVSHLVVLEL